MSDASIAERCDFFVSYTAADRPWAEWIAWQLEDAGFSTRLQAWDFRPGGAFPQEMHEALQRAERTIAVLSRAYLESQYAAAEWLAVFRDDPTGRQRKLVPVRVEPCEPDGLLGSVIWIDLVGSDEREALERLLAGIRRERMKPTRAPRFPTTEPPLFPSPEASTPAVSTPAVETFEPRVFDWVEEGWSAMTLAHTLWVVEARGSALRFRRFGEHARARGSDLGSPLSHVAIAHDGTLVAAQVADGVRIARLDPRGRLSSWTACEVDEPSPARLVSVRGDERAPEVLMATANATFSLTPSTAGVVHRREVCSAPARCAASLGGAFLVVSSAGRVIRGVAPSSARDGWLDVDAGTGAGVELLAGIRQEDGHPVLLVARRDAREGELRRLAVPHGAERVRVARTPAQRDAPTQLVVEVGGGERMACSWDDLAAERSQP